MQKQSGISDFFRSKSPILRYMGSDVDPLIEELKQIINRLQMVGKQNPEVNQLFVGMKDIFYNMQALKQEIARNLKTAQKLDLVKYYKDKLSSFLQNLKGRVDQLSSLTNNDSILKKIYETQRGITNSIDNINNIDAVTQDQFTNVPVSPKAPQKQPLPAFLNKFVTTLNGYEEEGQMMDVEALRGMLSTWIRNYGVSLLDQEVDEYRNRYIPLSTFSQLINNENPAAPDVKKVQNRRIEPAQNRPFVEELGEVEELEHVSV